LARSKASAFHILIRYSRASIIIFFDSGLILNPHLVGVAGTAPAIKRLSGALGAFSNTPLNFVKPEGL
jgi:hypothetical protein